MAPQLRKSRTWIYVVVGILIVVLLACGGIAFALNRVANVANNVINSVNQTETAVAQNPNPSPNPTTPASGAHISNVHIGTGDSQGNITNQTTNFTQSDTIIINFTATTQDSNAQVTLQILDSTGTALQSNFTPLVLKTGQHDYFFSFSITGADTYKAEIQYNGTTEQTVSFTVT